MVLSVSFHTACKIAKGIRCRGNSDSDEITQEHEETSEDVAYTYAPEFFTVNKEVLFPTKKWRSKTKTASLYKGTLHQVGVSVQPQLEVSWKHHPDQDISARFQTKMAFKIAMGLFVLLVAIAATQGADFKVRSPDSRYGYLRCWGFHAPSSKHLAEFTTARSTYRRFRFLANGALYNVASRECLNLFSPTNQQLVLKRNCNDPAVDQFAYNSITQQLVHSGTNKCVSVWNYLAADPANVDYVPGLNDCSPWTKIILEEY